MSSLARSTDARPQHELAVQRSPLAGKRIGFVSTVVEFGGSEVLVADAMEASLNAGAEVVCFCHGAAAIRDILQSRSLQAGRIKLCDWPPDYAAESNSAGSTPRWSGRQSLKRIYRQLAPLSVKRYFGFLADARRFYHELQHHCLDALLINVNGSEASAVAAGRWSRSRTIACYHLLWTEPEGTWLARVADRVMRQRSAQAAGWVLHVSAAARDQWCRAVRLPISRTHVIYSGVEDSRSVDRQRMRASLRLSPQTFAFCVPGRFDAIKGHQYLLEGVSRFVSELQHCTVILCGDGPLADQLRQRVAALRLSHLVQFLGFRRDLPQVLAASDCTVLPSLSENLSIAILESLTAGTPAIVTDVGAMSEVVIDGVNGFVVPPANADALGRAMVAMANDRDRAREMRCAARDDALARYTRQRMMDDYVRLFSHVISNANA